MTVLTQEELLQRTLSHLNEYIHAADRKASILLTAQLTFIALYANVIITIRNDIGFWVTLITGGSVFFGICAGFLSLLVIYPRTSKPPKGYLLWTKIDDLGLDDYQSGIKAMDENDLFNELTVTNYELSRVATKKYSRLRLSLIATIPMILLAIAALTIFILR